MRSPARSGRFRLIAAVMGGAWIAGAAIAAASGWPVRAAALLLLSAATAAAVRAAYQAGRASRAQYIRSLEHQALVDELTGLANRRAFIERLSLEMQRAQRYGRPLSLALIDLDGFKAVNDTFGHVVGDMTLVAFGGVLANAIRATDMAVRLGGDEFALLLVEADAADAARVVERVRAAVEGGPLLSTPASGMEVHVRMSAGIAALSAAHTSITDLVSAADHALYSYKRAGAPREKNGTPMNADR